MFDRGQSAVEFMILIGVVLFIFSLFLIVIQNNVSDKFDEDRDRIALEIVLTVQDEINLASESSDGYSRNFKIPSRVGSLGYNISIIESNVFLITEDGRHAVSLPIPEAVEGEIYVGENSITKEGGVVHINNF